MPMFHVANVALSGAFTVLDARLCGKEFVTFAEKLKSSLNPGITLIFTLASTGFNNN